MGKLAKNAKLSGETTFTIDNQYEITAWYWQTYKNWGHYARLYSNGLEIESNKIVYCNRTWESYTYESVIHGLINSTTRFSETAKEYIKSKIDAEAVGNEEKRFAFLGAIAKMGDILTDNKKDSNDWKARMLKAGLPELDIPEDWGQLTEDERETRLNSVLSVLNSKEEK